jgi:hypothetical protein
MHFKNLKTQVASLLSPIDDLVLLTLIAWNIKQDFYVHLIQASVKLIITYKQHHY